MKLLQPQKREKGEKRNPLDLELSTWQSDDESTTGFFLIFCQDWPKYFVALKTIARWNCHFPPNYFPSCSWPVFASIPNQQLDLPHFRWDPCCTFPFPAVSPSASQETLGSSEVALVPPALGHLLSPLGPFQRVQVMLVTVPRSLPLFPLHSPRVGSPSWASPPEQPKPFQLLFLRFLWAGRGREGRLPVGPRVRQEELIGVNWNKARSQAAAI